MNKIIYGIDEKGFMTYETLEIGVSNEIPEGYIDIPLPTDAEGNQLPFWKPQWNGVEWIESRPKKDIETEKNEPQALTPVEYLQEDMANLWYDSMMKDIKIQEVEEFSAEMAYDSMMKDEKITELDSAQSELTYLLMMNGVL